MTVLTFLVLVSGGATADEITLAALLADGLGAMGSVVARSMDGPRAS